MEGPPISLDINLQSLNAFLELSKLLEGSEKESGLEVTTIYIKISFKSLEDAQELWRRSEHLEFRPGLESLRSKLREVGASYTEEGIQASQTSSSAPGWKTSHAPRSLSRRSSSQAFLDDSESDSGLGRDFNRQQQARSQGRCNRRGRTTVLKKKARTRGPTPPPVLDNSEAPASGSTSAPASVPTSAPALTPSVSSLNPPPIPEPRDMNYTCRTFLAPIVKLCEDFLVQSYHSEPHPLSDLLNHVIQQSRGSSPAPPFPPSQDILPYLANCCCQDDLEESYSHLRYFIHSTLFAIVAQRETTKSRSSLPRDLFKKLRKDNPTLPSVKKLEQYYQHGSYAISLCSGGSIFLLFVLSTARCNKSLYQMDGASVNEIARFLRCPGDFPIGKKISKYLIPTLEFLRIQSFNEGLSSFCDFFPDSFMWRWIGDFANLNCGDLHRGDVLWDSFAVNDIKKPRNWQVWNNWRFPLFPGISFNWQITNIPEYLSVSNPRKAFVIATKFDFSLHDSKLVIPPDDEERWKTTEEYRRLASNSLTPKTLAQFENMVQDQLQFGKRVKPDNYIKFDFKMLPRDQIIRINDCRDDLVAFFAKLSPHLAEELMDNLQIVFSDALEYRDTKKTGAADFFWAFHFSFYNRYSKRGDNAPGNQDPADFQNNPSHPVNTTANIPRASKDRKDNIEAYHSTNELLQPVFGEIQDLVKEWFPTTYDKLSKFCDTLPGNEKPPAYPFSGYVVNVNVATRIHRDIQDDEICIVLVSNKDCEGGELVLVEPGLVLDMQCGDIVVFPSFLISHFNMHFEGKRLSVVFHSDKMGEDWVRDRNGWQKNMFFNN